MHKVGKRGLKLDKKRVQTRQFSWRRGVSDRFWFFTYQLTGQSVNRAWTLSMHLTYLTIKANRIEMQICAFNTLKCTTKTKPSLNIGVMYIHGHCRFIFKTFLREIWQFLRINDVNVLLLYALFRFASAQNRLANLQSCLGFVNI